MSTDRGYFVFSFLFLALGPYTQYSRWHKNNNNKLFTLGIKSMATTTTMMMMMMMMMMLAYLERHIQAVMLMTSMMERT